MRALTYCALGFCLGAAFDMTFVHNAPVYGWTDAALVLGPSFLGLLYGASADA